jgi:hypothetical protein
MRAQGEHLPGDLEHRVLEAEPEILDRPSLRETARAQLANAAYGSDPENAGMPRRALEVVTREGTRM